MIAATYVRIASYSGRMDLSPGQAALLEDLAARRDAAARDRGVRQPVRGRARPEAAGAPARPTSSADAPEAAAVRALCGEAPIGGKLPISIPGLFPFGHGLERAAVPTVVR